MNKFNSDRRASSISLFFVLVSIGIIAYPVVYDSDMIRFGYGTIIIGMFILSISFMLFLTFRKRARVMNNILNGENIIDSWEYSEEEKKKDCQLIKEDENMMRIASSVLGGIFIVIGFIVFLTDTDENRFFLFLMLLVGGIIIGIVRLASIVRMSDLKHKEWNAVFTHEGLYFKGILYSWISNMTTLECVLVDPFNDNNLLIIYTQIQGRYLRKVRHYIRIPIPNNKKIDSIKIVEKYNLVPSEEVFDYINSLKEDKD